MLRELREETGLITAEVGAELWRRNHLLNIAGQEILQKESYFLVRTPRFEPRAEALEHGNERNWFRGFGWWAVAALPDNSAEFAPTQLGKLVRAVLQSGPPNVPLQIGV